MLLATMPTTQAWANGGEGKVVGVEEVKAKGGEGQGVRGTGLRYSGSNLHFWIPMKYYDFGNFDNSELLSGVVDSEYCDFRNIMVLGEILWFLNGCQVHP